MSRSSWGRPRNEAGRNTCGTLCLEELDAVAGAADVTLDRLFCRTIKGAPSCTSPALGRLWLYLVVVVALMTSTGWPAVRA